MSINPNSTHTSQATIPKTLLFNYKDFISIHNENIVKNRKGSMKRKDNVILLDADMNLNDTGRNHNWTGSVVTEDNIILLNSEINLNDTRRNDDTILDCI